MRPPVNQMRAIGVREALSGPWSFNASGWLILFLPSTALVFVQNAATPFPDASYVMLSAVLQHLIAGIVSIPAAALLRGGSLPIWLSFALWTGIGLARGLVDGFMASTFAGVDPDFAVRIVSWLLASWVWMPLFSYTAAQSQNRRMLLGGLGDAVKRRDATVRLRGRSTEDVHDQLIRAMQNVVQGAIDEIRASLIAAGPGLDADQLRLVGDRLASASHQVSRLVERLGNRTDGEPSCEPSTGAPLLAAMIFERRRPWLSSTLATAALLTVLAPLCLHVEGWAFLGTLGLALLISTCALAFGSRAALVETSSLGRQVTSMVARYGAAGLSAAVPLAIMQWNDLDTFTTVIILLLPVGVAFSAFVVSGAVGLADANLHALDSLNAIEAERVAIAAAAEREENSIRDQLSEVVHGPVLGRLAACAMALNFHAAVVDSVPQERTDRVTEAVIAHLDAAMADVESLTR